MAKQLEDKCNRLMTKLVDQEEELRDSRAECEIVKSKLRDMQQEHSAVLRDYGTLKSHQGRSFPVDSVEAVLATLVQRKTAEIDGVLASAESDATQMSQDSMRDVEKAFSDACDAMVAHPHDFCTPSSFLNLEKVTSAMCANETLRKHESLQGLVRTLRGLAQFSPDGSVLLNVPRDCVPVDAITRGVTAGQEVTASRNQFEEDVHAFNVQVDSTKDFSLQAAILRNTLQLVAQHSSDSLTTTSFESSSAAVDDLIAEANKIDAVVSDNVCILRHKCGRAREDASRRLSQLEKEVQYCDHGMVQHRGKVVELVQAVEAILGQISEAYTHMARNAQRQTELRGTMSVIASFPSALTRREETEVERQNRIKEGAKTTLVLCSKVKELFRREAEKADEVVRKHKDTVRRTRWSVHERMYTVCQDQFEAVSRMCASHRNGIRREQQKLLSANRIVGSGVLTEDIEKKVQDDLMLTALSKINVAKEALAQAEVEIEAVKAALASTNTLMELGKSTSFLDDYEATHRAENMSNKLEDLVTYMKSASELMVQCVDGEDAACCAAVQTCLSECSMCLLELRSHAPRLQHIEESVRNAAITKLRRYRRMITDSLKDLHESTPSLYEDLHVLVSDVMAQCDDVGGALLTLHAPPTPERAGSAVSSAHSSMRRGFLPSASFGSAPTRRTEVVTPDFVMDEEVIDTVSSQGTTANPTPVIQSRAPTPRDAALHTPIAVPTPTPLGFGRHSAKLTVTTGAAGPGKRIRKGVGHMEVSDSCALTNLGFSAGRHMWRVKLGHNCDRLMVGVCDAGLPVDGYCNSLRYKNCYFLHLGTGALWSPFLGMQRVPYADGAMCNPDGEVTVVLDLNTREISYGWGRAMLPVAFRGIQLPPGGELYPCFEVYNNGCEFELVD